jgi:hypothetical protein
MAFWAAVRLSAVVTKRRMPIGKKAKLVHLAIWALIFGFFARLAYGSQLAASVTFTAMVLLVTWSIDFVCPHCEHPVGSRPLKWLHDFPIGSHVFHRRCFWCGHDLRA